MSKASKLHFAGTTAALVAVIAVGFVAGASAEPGGKRGIDAVIEIKLKHGDPTFKGPDTVEQFGEIQVINETSGIGPHTFSLVKKSKLPKGESERVKCGRFKLDVCKDIAAAHDMTRHPIVVNGDREVESGDPGWNASFNGNSDGDSWFTDTENEDTERVATDEGKLYFQCIIHPHMQGEIKVVSP